MSNVDRKLHLYRVFNNNPMWIDITKEAIAVCEKKIGKDRQPDFEWYEVHASPVVLRKMVTEGILDITLSTRKSTWFSIRDIECLKDVIKAVEKKQETNAIDVSTVDIPNDLFDIIVSYDTYKYVIRRALDSEKPVHILFYGPPATAKTLFLEELSRLPNARYVLGSAMSRAGIVDFLLENEPRYLIIDEIEKAQGKDLASLLSLMQTGIVSRLKKNMREQKRLQTWVFAGANYIKRIPPELLSRFIKLPFKEYSKEEFVKIVISILQRESIDKAVAAYIANKLVTCTKDVRDAIKIARLASTKEEVDSMIKILYAA